METHSNHATTILYLRKILYASFLGSSIKVTRSEKVWWHRQTLCFVYACIHLELDPCKGIQDSLVMDSGYFQELDSRGTWSLHWIPILSRIPDSLSCIPDSKAQDPGIHTQKFPGFWNKDSLNTWWSPIRLPGKLKNLHLPLLCTSSFSVYRQKRTMMQKALRRVDNFVQIYKAHWSCID